MHRPVPPSPDYADKMDNSWLSGDLAGSQGQVFPGVFGFGEILSHSFKKKSCGRGYLLVAVQSADQNRSLAENASCPPVPLSPGSCHVISKAFQ